MSQQVYENAPQENTHQPSNTKLGIFFLLLAAIFMAGNAGVEIFGMDAYVLFALLPAFWVGTMLYDTYQREGSLDRQAIVPILFALLPFAYVAGAIMGLDVGKLWPVGILLVGLMFLLKPSGNHSSDEN